MDRPQVTLDLGLVNDLAWTGLKVKASIVHHVNLAVDKCTYKTNMDAIYNMQGKWNECPSDGNLWSITLIRILTIIVAKYWHIDERFYTNL